MKNRRGLSAFRFLAVLGLALLASANPSLAQRPNGPPNFDAFKMVHQRNIFDPERRPPVTKGSATPPPAAAPDYVALTGTLVTEDKALAFFSGSLPDYNKVLHVNEKMADATITKVEPAAVTVQRGGKTLKINVGWTLPLKQEASAPAPGGGDDQMATAVPSFASAAPPPPGPVPGQSPASPPAVPPAQAGANPPPPPVAGPAPVAAAPNDDVARMMRARRQQEVQ